MARPTLCRPLVLALLLAACASRIPETGFAEPQVIEGMIKRYYERNASEENQTCLTPYIDGLTRVTVVDQQPDRLVLDARYLYRDRFKNDRENQLNGECIAYAERQFTLAKTDAGIQVVAMSEFAPLTALGGGRIAKPGGALHDGARKSRRGVMAETAAPPRPAEPFDGGPGYDQDFVLWTERQAKLIHAGRFDLVDWQNVAKEIEAMGSRERRELGTRLKILMMHLLKWQSQSQKRSGSWRTTINDQRDEIEQLLTDDPSLRHEVDSAIHKRYRTARANAAGETGLPLKSLPVRCPYAAEQILDEAFFPGPIDET